MKLLLHHIAQDGTLQDDTHIFEEAYDFWIKGGNTKVIFIAQTVTEVEFQSIKETMLL